MKSLFPHYLKVGALEHADETAFSIHEKAMPFRALSRTALPSKINVPKRIYTLIGNLDLTDDCSAIQIIRRVAQ
jgi:hypothetical protein